MKNAILLILGFFFTSLNAQVDTFTCSEILTIEKDRMTENVTVSLTDPIMVTRDNKTGLGVHLIKNAGDKSFLCYFLAIGKGCIDDYAKAVILFTDGTTKGYINATKFNCDGKFLLTFFGLGGLTKKDYSLFTEKHIQAVRVWTRDGYIEEDIDINDAERLRKAMECIKEM